MMQAAIRFRDRVWKGEYHADCMQDALEECGDAASEEMDAGQLEFGYWVERGGQPGEFQPLPAMDQRVREDWYGKGDFFVRPISLKTV